jgi:hypothetical protein
MRFLLPAVLVTALTSSSGEAADNYTAAGLGAVSCGAWTAARRDRQAGDVEQWILGFLTGMADLAASVPVQSKMDPLSGVDAEAVWAWVDNFCRAHPLEKVVRAGEAFATAHPEDTSRKR